MTHVDSFCRLLTRRRRETWTFSARFGFSSGRVSLSTKTMIRMIYRLTGTLLRLAVVVANCYGIWCCLEFARADFYFQKDSEESLRSAIRIAPDGWEYYLRLAQLDNANARSLLTTSLEHNRYDAQAYIELALNYEASGDIQKAEKLLLQAYQVDDTYLPRWSLANFYLRHDDLPQFWIWARKASEMPSDDIGLLFELCRRVSPDPQKISDAILNNNPDFLRQYIRWLLSTSQPDAIVSVAPHLLAVGDPASDRPLLFAVVNRMTAAREGSAADALWRLLIARHWAIADTTLPNNPRFERRPLSVNFDWSLPEYLGLHSWPGVSGLEIEFSGSEPEQCTIAEQLIFLQPGRYTLTYSYRTVNIAPMTGVHWQIVDPSDNSVIAESEDLSSDKLQASKVPFSAPDDHSLVRIRLAYKRSLGTPRIVGTLVVSSTQISGES